MAETETRILVRTFPVGPLQCNCTLIGNPATGEAIVVDPGGDPEKIMTKLGEMGLSKVVKILHTHAHFDHFLASGVMRENTGAPLCLNWEDLPLWERLEDQCALYGIPYAPVPPPDHYLEHEEDLTFSDVCGKALHTPGHSPGSMSFLFEAQNLLIAGDTLFKNSIGRTDLWGGDFQTIERSIKQRLYTLDEKLQVVCGHGAPTTLGHEMRNNPFVKA